MGKWIWVIILIMCAIPLSLPGQTVQDKQEITRLQNGQYAFVEGAVQVTFTDTTSEATARKQLEAAGYTILQLNIYPISARTRPNLDEQQLAEISAHPFVEEVIAESSEFPEEAFEEMVKRDSLNEEESKAARERFKSMAETVFVRVILKNHITPEMAEELPEVYKEVELKLNMISPRTAVVESKVGEEAITIRRLKELPIVKNSAFIGRIESN